MYKVKFSKDVLAIYVASDYVSNGHWAVKTAQAENRAAFASIETAKAVYPKHKVQTIEHDIFLQKPEVAQVWTVTKWKYGLHKFDGVVLTSPDGQAAIINAEYLKMFGLDYAGATLLGDTPTRPFFQNADDSDFVIMPAVIPKDEKLRLVCDVSEDVVAA
jgi:hypothetical protein